MLMLYSQPVISAASYRLFGGITDHTGKQSIRKSAF